MPSIYQRALAQLTETDSSLTPCPSDVESVNHGRTKSHSGGAPFGEDPALARQEDEPAVASDMDIDIDSSREKSGGGLTGSSTCFHAHCLYMREEECPR